MLWRLWRLTSILRFREINQVWDIIQCDLQTNLIVCCSWIFCKFRNIINKFWSHSFYGVASDINKIYIFSVHFIHIYSTFGLTSHFFPPPLFHENYSERKQFLLDILPSFAKSMEIQDPCNVDYGDLEHPLTPDPASPSYPQLSCPGTQIITKSLPNPTHLHDAQCCSVST